MNKKPYLFWIIAAAFLFMLTTPVFAAICPPDCGGPDPQGTPAPGGGLPDGTSGGYLPGSGGSMPDGGGYSGGGSYGGGITGGGSMPAAGGGSTGGMTPSAGTAPAGGGTSGYTGGTYTYNGSGYAMPAYDANTGMYQAYVYSYQTANGEQSYMMSLGSGVTVKISKAEADKYLGTDANKVGMNLVYLPEPVIRKLYQNMINIKGLLMASGAIMGPDGPMLIGPSLGFALPTADYRKANYAAGPGGGQSYAMSGPGGDDGSGGGDEPGGGGAPGGGGPGGPGPGGDDQNNDNQNNGNSGGGNGGSGNDSNSGVGETALACMNNPSAACMGNYLSTTSVTEGRVAVFRLDENGNPTDPVFISAGQVRTV